MNHSKTELFLYALSLSLSLTAFAEKKFIKMILCYLFYSS